MLVLPKIDMAVLVYGGLGIAFYLIAFPWQGISSPLSISMKSERLWNITFP
jgi:hypothetical protein